MGNNLLLEFQVDKENNTITVRREFDAPVLHVWDAYTKSELLDQWWAPKPWKSRTRSMDFREGGFWHYAMVGPAGEEHWARADFKKIIPYESFTVVDAFADAEGNITDLLAPTHWNVSFQTTGRLTLVTCKLTFPDPENLEKILEMGFKEGYIMALGNLDELLRTM